MGHKMPVGISAGILNAVIIVGLIWCYFGGYLPKMIVGVVSEVLAFANILTYRKRRTTSY
jgi:hypothetical protein